MAILGGWGGGSCERGTPVLNHQPYTRDMVEAGVLLPGQRVFLSARGAFDEVSSSLLDPSFRDALSFRSDIIRSIQRVFLSVRGAFDEATPKPQTPNPKPYTRTLHPGP